ncbi:hypothetical protein BP5796_12615 [Coleophoma crateriformis]|uniref:Uncharacterized protein n=1 Tax=Coleophoma crateriformis TaxID=565419 RepID=A0A3D8Q8Q2_9HELO|nr:hypothetical protein BP5796_12615 [Coleophoma crateriformis]
MVTPTVGFHSYVDIAVSIAAVDCNLIAQQRASSESWDDLLGVNTTDKLRLEWENRVESWVNQHKDGHSVPLEKCERFEDLDFSTFFLQHPISAMSLWNVMQGFHALDRVVCGTSKEALESIAEWESMKPFAYINASKVEKRWRSSLQSIKKEIKAGLYSDVYLTRMRDMKSGVDKLEDAWLELQQSFAENFQYEELSGSMLERIKVGIARRFSMFNNYLVIDEESTEESSNEAVDIKESGIVFQWFLERFLLTDITKAFTAQEPMLFKLPSRTNSMQAVKEYGKSTLLIIPRPSWLTPQ